MTIKVASVTVVVGIRHERRRHVVNVVPVCLGKQRVQSQLCNDANNILLIIFHADYHNCHITSPYLFWHMTK